MDYKCKSWLTTLKKGVVICTTNSSGWMFKKVLKDPLVYLYEPYDDPDFERAFVDVEDLATGVKTTLDLEEYSRTWKTVEAREKEIRELIDWDKKHIAAHDNMLQAFINAKKAVQV